MTVLVGIIWSHGIIIAADSQFTDPATGVVEFGNKINVIQFKLADEILVAEAGIPSITNRVIEIIREKAIGVEIKNVSTVIRIAEDSVRELKSQCDKEQWDHGQYNGGAAIMIAFLANKKPHLYTLNIYGNGVAEKPLKHYVTSGVGQILAEYLLSESAEPNSSDIEAIATAIYVIKKVKDHQKGACGGETNINKLGYVDSTHQENGYISKSIRISQEFVNRTEEELNKKAGNFIKARNKQAALILRKIGGQIWWKHVKKVEAEQEARLAKLPKNNP